MQAMQLLDRITIPTPCRADWDSMQGDERSRFCSRCEKHVYNLTAMTAQESVALIREKEGKLCARFFRRPDGTVVTANCTPAAPRKLSPWQVSLRSVVGIVTCCATAMGIGRLIPKEWLDPPPKPAASALPVGPCDVEGGVVEIDDEWMGEVEELIGDEPAS
jgi:hypothetical protein